MLVFLLSSLYAQEPSSEESDAPTTTEEEGASDASKNEEKTSNEEGSEEGDKSEQPPDELMEDPGEEQTESQENTSEESKTDESASQKDSSNSEGTLDIDTKDIPKEVPERENGVVTLKNGDVLHGSILDGENGVHIDVGGEEDLHVPESSILTLSYPKGKFMQEDLGYMRYFYSPTAMPMKPKTGYVSQKELLFSAVAYSPVQDVSFLVGTSVPIALYSVVYGEFDSLLGIAGFRYGTKVYDKFYVGGGVESFIFAGESVSLPFVNASYGNSEQHVTIGGGVGVSNFNLDQATIAPIFLSAYKRITPSIALITENWTLVSPSYDYVSTGELESGCVPYYEGECDIYEDQYDWGNPSVDLFAASVGVRFISKKFTTDIGLINIITNDAGYIPVPWLDVSWYFGNDVE